MSDSKLIDALGGPTRVAELLGYDKAGGVQRVHNWRHRGIPARVKLERSDVFAAALVDRKAADVGGLQVKHEC